MRCKRIIVSNRHRLAAVAAAAAVVVIHGNHPIAGLARMRHHHRPPPTATIIATVTVPIGEITCPPPMRVRYMTMTPMVIPLGKYFPIFYKEPLRPS